MMQKNRQSKPGPGLLRVFVRLLLVYISVVTLYLLWCILLRVKWVSEKTRRFSKTVNPLALKIAGSRFGTLYWNLSLLKHRGRRSGREYETPLAAYPFGDGFILALTYGPDVDWCRNVLATGKCTLLYKGQEYALEKPEIIPVSEALNAYPYPVKILLAAAGVQQGLWMHKQSVVPQQDPALI